MKKKITGNSISKIISIVAIVICIVMLIVELVNKTHKYTIWFVLLFSNISIFTSNIAIYAEKEKNNKADDIKKINE